jgi:hypothetical protein
MPHFKTNVTAHIISADEACKVNLVLRKYFKLYADINIMIIVK